MPRSKAITEPQQRLVNHEELRALVAHISALISALTVRVDECERVLAVDPEVGELAAAFLNRVRGEIEEPSRALSLMGPEQ